MAKEIKQMKKPVWLKYSESEVKEIILKIAEKDPEMTAEKIGLILRDNYGIPKTKVYGFKIGEVLKEKNLYKNPDEKNLLKKVENLEKHLARNHGDKRAGRSMIISRAKQKKAKDYLAR